MSLAHVSQNGCSVYEMARLVAAKMSCDEKKMDELIVLDFETCADRPRDFRPPSKKTEEAGSHLGAFEEILDACLRDFGLD